MSTYAVVDSGTTNTRLRLVSEGQVLWSGSRSVGARDTARENGPGLVLTALRELLAEAGSEPEAIICSGMITSNMGLLEVPHLTAPASLDELSAAMVQKEFTELGSVPLTFIPGVKTLPAGDAFDDLTGGDMLRGEETEIAGLLAELDLTGNCVFLHMGSHHKVIEFAADGAIVGSRTAITGELLAAIVERTILHSSLLPFNELQLDLDAAMAGAEAAQKDGIGRALFLVRVGEQLAGKTREAMSSFCLGALATLDLPLLQGIEVTVPLVVYGQGHFPLILKSLLERQGYPAARLVPAEVADHCAAIGAVALFMRAQNARVMA